MTISKSTWYKQSRARVCFTLSLSLPICVAHIMTCSKTQTSSHICQQACEPLPRWLHPVCDIPHVFNRQTSILAPHLASQIRLNDGCRTVKSIYVNRYPGCCCITLESSQPRFRFLQRRSRPIGHLVNSVHRVDAGHSESGQSPNSYRSAFRLPSGFQCPSARKRLPSPVTSKPQNGEAGLKGVGFRALAIARSVSISL